MNTSRLKRFAQETRKKLLDQVSAKVDYVLASDTPELREKAALVTTIREELAADGKQQLIERVAYTWFNRFVALRYMDINDYQPLGIKIVSSLPGHVSPHILQEAISGQISTDLHVNAEKVIGLLDGRIQSRNPENDAYRLLLIAACNYLNRIFPFLFEQINDYTELLLPDDLTSQFSVLHDFLEGMIDEDCRQVECIGWIYQFYISELNEELISSKRQYEVVELAPASQLFTPKWIVKYMVENTLGQVWKEINPSTKIIDSLNFYIKPAYEDFLKLREKKSVEELKFLEPCVGSGHILAYAFDVFYKIYEEEGYNPSEIPELIITKNLWGTDIDPRAAQLASFVLMMKGREKLNRFLKKSIQPNIFYYEDFPSDSNFEYAASLGSLIRVNENEIETQQVDANSLFTDKQTHLRNLYRILGQKYDVVVTNPPYISSSRMEGRLKQYVEVNFPKAKSDLFSAFVLRCLELTNEEGLTGYMTPFVWMFISSYEELRKEIIDRHFINNLIQLEYSGFDGATVPICTFTLRNGRIKDGKGSYIRLSDFKGPKLQEPKTLEAIRNCNCGWFYTASQNVFEKIPGSPIAFWVSKSFAALFEDNELSGKFLWADGKNVTSDSARFIRFHWEVEVNKIRNEYNQKQDDFKWVNLSKGGAYKRWYGNLSNIIDWSKSTREYYRKFSIARIIPQEQWYQEGISWTKISSNKLTAFRYFPEGGTFDDSGLTVFFSDVNKKYIWYFLGLLNSRIFEKVNETLNQTLNLLLKDVRNLPVIFVQEEKLFEISQLVKNCVEIAKLDWSKYEEGWDFKRSEFLSHKGQDLEETYDLFQQYWRTKFFQLHKNEEKLNRHFIEIYGLQEELTADVPLKEISILAEEMTIDNGQLLFHSKDILTQFISYAVGCMFGRYSLDKQDLILANQGETVNDFYQRIGNSERNVTFAPDTDNIIPILEDEWFEDDAVSQFYNFLKASFGEKNFQKNLTFLEDQLGCSVRKYFIREFYPDHIQRYKKRPIYWMFSSPKGHFNVLIYMHRYTPDTLNVILNKYLRTFIEKIRTRLETLKHVENTGSAGEKTRALKEMDKINTILLDCQDYERNILFPLATERIAIDLDNGVLVNYNCFGKAVKEVAGLNDSKTKKKVKEFDWIDPKMIR